MPPTATKAGGSTADSTAAILQAMRLVAGSAPAAGPPPAQNAVPAAVPSARFRVAVDELAGAGTYAGLDATRPNLKAILTNALNWSGQPRATKPVTKAVGAAMSGTGENGFSTYPQAIEMLSFLGLCAPLLEPDRLARIAALAPQTANAYQPIRYLVRPAAQLQKLLGRYNDARREALLASLWVTAHEGRWWDATGGVTPGTDRRRRRRTQDDLPQEQREAIADQVRAVFNDRKGTPNPEVISEAFENRLLTYSDDAAAIMGRVVLRNQAEHRELVAHVKHPDADVPILLSYVPELLPDERAESPIPALIDQLVKDLGDDIDEPDAMPDKPDDWAELYPGCSREGFPMPNRMTKLDKAALPALPGARLTMMRHADMLQRNATHMGNCTFSYRTQCENGTAFIGHLAYDGGEYNFAIVARQVNNGAPLWTAGEMNSRFNRGNVPQVVRTQLTRLIDSLNA